jgi:hypothetical protein
VHSQLDDEVKSIRELKTDDVANAVLALVKAIDPAQPFPRTLPRQMSQKVSSSSSARPRRRRCPPLLF